MEKAFKSILFEGVVLAILLSQIIQPTTVIGRSMYPHLKDGDYLVLNKKAYVFEEPEYGDIITFPRDGELLIKRIIGKPGDTIVIKGGKVYRNGSRVDDYVADDVITEPEMTVKLNSNQYFVLGDNREGSLDSRNHEVGTVKEDEIEGKAIFRLYPHMGKL